MRPSQARLRVAVVVFAFDPDPATPTASALTVLTISGHLPEADVAARERFADAARRAIAGAGLRPGGGAGSRRSPRLHLVGIDDEPGRNRAVVAHYCTTAVPTVLKPPGSWTRVSRLLRGDAATRAVVRAALGQLVATTRFVAGAAALLGDVFTGEDLLRVLIALHGGPRGSDRTFRRRLQELRDAGVLVGVRAPEVAALRRRVARFRSAAGTGGRPPELLRYAGGGGEDEPLTSLRVRRPA